MTYDEQIAHLTKHPEDIFDHWMSGLGLFKILGPKNGIVGCLTTIRNSMNTHNNKVFINGVINKELTQEIYLDKRIPKTDNQITIKSLPVFKEWQERIDKLQNPE